LEEKLRTVFAGKYNPNEILGGPEKVARRIFDEYSKNYRSIFIGYFFDGKKYGIFKKLFGFEIAGEVNKNKIIRAGIFRIFLLLFRIKPEIIHIITFERFALICLFYKLFKKVKIILNIHGFVSYENENFRKPSRFLKWKDKIAERIFIKKADKIIVNSFIAKGIFSKQFHISNSKLIVIPNGVDKIFSTDSTRNKEFGIDGLKIIFPYNPQRIEKGFEFLIETLGELNFSIQLFITCNDGSKNKTYNYNRKHLELIFIGEKTPLELSVIYKRLDMVICASSFELFSIATAEALSAGLIPVVTSKAGISEFIINGENGFVFDYGNTAQLADIINKLFNDISLRKNISVNASKIYNKLNWDEIYSEYEKLYKTFYR